MLHTLDQRISFGYRVWIAIVETIFRGWMAAWLLSWTLGLFRLPKVAS